MGVWVGDGDFNLSASGQHQSSPRRASAPVQSTHPHRKPSAMLEDTFIYTTFFMLGASTLFPWLCFISAVDYFQVRTRLLCSTWVRETNLFHFCIHRSFTTTRASSSHLPSSTTSRWSSQHSS
jgi:hypothetical protein